MSDLEYLEYSAKEPMALLRKKFNNGADIFKTSPTTLTAEDASADVKYLKYVFENAYSGFSYYDKPLFDTAFASIVKSLKNSAQITPDQLIDVICSNLSFISDGHLALTTADYGNGFYKELQTYACGRYQCVETSRCTKESTCRQTCGNTLYSPSGEHFKAHYFA